MIQKRYLIFEPEYFGHHVSYVQILLSFINCNSVNHEFIFITHPEVIKRLKSFHHISDSPKQNNIKLISLKNHEILKCNTKNLVLKSLACWLTTKMYANQLKADHIHYLYLDHMQLPLSLRLPLPKAVTISGILFRPSVHYSQFSKNDRNIKEIIRDARKNVFYRFMLKNPIVSVVFTLDQYFLEYYKERLHNSNKLRFLPDPTILTENNGQFYSEEPTISFRNTTKLFLLFGALDERKGIYRTLEAICKLHPDVLDKARFIYAGQLNPHIEHDFIERLKKARHSNQNMNVDIQNQYLSNQEIRELVKACDVVLMPYQRHVGSSGLLLTAAAFRKPVITQDFGLLGTLTKKYRLGLVVDTIDPHEIAKAIERFVYSDVSEYEVDPQGMANFVNNRTPELFASTLISTITQL
jgi:glycosyltransferase involved in cell wall biosynthesis